MMPITIYVPRWIKYPILYKRPWNEHITGIPKIESYEEFLNTLLILDRNKRPTYKNIFILVGPSASGKSSLVDKLMQKDCNISKTISYTTRPPFVIGADLEHFISL